MALFSGAVAQLGERSNRTAEVVGSIPSGSTIHFIQAKQNAIGAESGR
jgi:hypothetical protein